MLHYLNYYDFTNKKKEKEPPCIFRACRIFLPFCRFFISLPRSSDEKFKRGGTIINGMRSICIYIYVSLYRYLQMVL